MLVLYVGSLGCGWDPDHSTPNVEIPLYPFVYESGDTLEAFTGGVSSSSRSSVVADQPEVINSRIATHVPPESETIGGQKGLSRLEKRGGLDDYRSIRRINIL